MKGEAFSMGCMHVPPWGFLIVSQGGGTRGQNLAGGKHVPVCSLSRIAQFGNYISSFQLVRSGVINVPPSWRCTRCSLIG